MRLRIAKAPLKVPLRPVEKARPKVADAHYQTPEHKAWAREVIARAGGRCQWPGCTKAIPNDRVVADHITEIKDGGATLDPANGQCLCVQHNTLKAALARRSRSNSRVDIGAPGER